MHNRLNRDQVAHIVRSASAITRAREIVLIGTAAVIAQVENLPARMARTREVDLYVPGAEDVEAASDLVDGTIGEGSSFDSSFGYYAHGIGANTAHLPEGWETRANRLTMPTSGPEDAIAICPDIHDIAASKLSAWREKDKEWLLCGLQTRLLSAKTLAERAKAIRHPEGVSPQDVDRRLRILASMNENIPNGPER